jgi:hypothetical protein
MHLEPAQRRFAVPGADAGSAADEQGVHARLLDIDPGPRYDPCCTRRGRNAVHTLADLWRFDLTSLRWERIVYSGNPPCSRSSLCTRPL